MKQTWVTDRDVDYGPWEDNTATSAQTMQIGMYMWTPKSKVWSPLELWVPGLEDTQDVSVIKNRFFLPAKPNDAKYLANSMIWENTDQITPIRRRLSIDGCTQSRLTAVSATRYILLYQVFEIKSYWFARRKNGFVLGRYSGWQWLTTEKHFYNHWVDVRKNGPSPEASVTLSPRLNEWKVVRAAAGWVRADGLSVLTSGGTMLVLAITS
jgi:hypothetical protein